MIETGELTLHFSSSRSGDRRARGGGGDKGYPTPPHGRRNFLKWGMVIAGGVAAAALGAKVISEQGKEVQKPFYQGWEKYTNTYLPDSVFAQISKDIAGTTNYPGFVEVGNLMVLHQANPNSLSKIHPQFVGPVRAKFTELVQARGAVAAFSQDVAGQWVNTQFKEIGTGKSQQFKMAKPTKIETEILITNSFSRAPEEVKKQRY